jgi:hypothetical protein
LFSEHLLIVFETTNLGEIMKLRRIWGIIAVSLSTVLLTTGCIKLEMDMTVATDDTVSGTMVFAISKSLAEMGAEESESATTPETDSLLANAENVKVEPFDDGEFVGSSYSFEALPLAQFAPQVGDNSAFAMERQGNNIVISGVLDTSTEGQELEENPFADSITEGFAASTSIRVSVTLPGEIIETNGQVDGQTITWNGSFGEKLEIQAIAVSPLASPVNWLLVGGIGGIVLGLVGLLVTWLSVRKKQKAESTPAGKTESKTAKPKKQTKAEKMAAEALAARPWYQKKRFAFPALGFLVVSLLAIAVGLVQPQAGSSNLEASNPSPTSSEDTGETQEENSQGSGSSGTTQSAAPQAPAAVPPPAAAPVAVAPKVEEAAPAPPPSRPAAPVVTVAPSETERQFLAREDALYYWSQDWYSRDGLINYLMSVGYTYDEAVYGTDSLGSSWYYDAELAAQEFISVYYYSRLGLIVALEVEGFTTDQATFGVDELNQDWYEEAYGAAVEYIGSNGYTQQEAYDQLIDDGFTQAEAEYGSYWAAQE